MALSPEENERIKNALGLRLTGNCPLCGVRNWVFGENLVLMSTAPVPDPSPYLRALATIATQGVGPRPGPVLPLLPVMCNNCGNTVLMNVYTSEVSDIWAAQIEAGTR